MTNSIFLMKDRVENEISLFPNPADESLNMINLPLGSTISLVSLDGKEVKKLKIKESSVFLDVSKFKPGTYFLSVRNQSVYFSIKVIIL